jgi:hypothetical protein
MKFVAGMLLDVLFPQRPVERFAQRLRATAARARRFEILAWISMAVLLAAIFSALLTR